MTHKVEHNKSRHTHFPSPSINSVFWFKLLEAEICAVEADQRHLGDPRPGLQTVCL